MDDEIRPTWRFAWGLWWRMFLIGLGIAVIIGLILFLVDKTIVPWWDYLGKWVGEKVIPWEHLTEWLNDWLSGLT